MQGDEDEEREGEGDACGSLGHEGDGEAGEEEVPGAGRVRELGEADEGEGAAEGEEDVHFADAGGVEEAEGGEEEEGAEPGGELIAAEGEPAVDEADKGDAGERGGEARGELGDAEELEGERSEPELERWLFEPGLGVPVGDEPGAGEHGAGDAGVDAFVPVGEAVVAEEWEEDDGGEEHGERGGDACGRMRFAGHGKTLRDPKGKD